MDISNEKRAGFMIGIGLLLSHADQATKDALLRTLESFGRDLHLELEKTEYGGVAASANVYPCIPPLTWNPETGLCE